jgi:hypothetical protein
VTERRIHAMLLERWLEVDARAVLGAKYERIERLV